MSIASGVRKMGRRCTAMLELLLRLYRSYLPPQTKRQMEVLFGLKDVKKKIIARYQQGKADVIVISFPKCGRTWLRLMIGRAFQEHFGLEYENILELDRLSGLREGIPFLLMSHDDDPHRKNPEELERSKAKYRNKKVIFLMRDPRDVIVSLYFQVTKRDNLYDAPLSQYIREKKGSLDSLLMFYKIWLENRTVPREFLLLRYEDMHRKPGKELRKVLAFIGLERVGDDIVNRAVEYAAFENMKVLERKGVFSSKRLRPGNREDADSYKTRRGKVGGYVDYMSKEDIEFVRLRMEESLPDFEYYNV